MTDEEREQMMDRLAARVEAVATTVELLAASTQQLAMIQQADAVRISRLEDVVTTLVTIAQRMDERVTLSEQRADNTDARLNSFIAAVERYITARGTNGDGQA